MGDKKQNKRNNNSYPNILLAVLLLYPILFSFSHSLTHHLEAHQHSHHACHHSDKSYNQPFNLSILSNVSHSDKCSICDYKFAPGIKSGKQAIRNKAFQLAVFNFPLSESISTQELFSKSSPRAPPVCV